MALPAQRPASARIGSGLCASERSLSMLLARIDKARRARDRWFMQWELSKVLADLATSHKILRALCLWFIDRTTLHRMDPLYASALAPGVVVAPKIEVHQRICVQDSALPGCRAQPCRSPCAHLRRYY